MTPDAPVPGSRVVLRYRLPDGSTPPFTDVIGVLTRSGAAVTVRPESGDPVTVPAERIVALKALAPRPVRNSEIRGLESAAADAWPGLEQEWIGGWLLRAGAGVTRRGNSASPLRPDASTVDLPAVAAWYRDRDLQPSLSLPDRLLRPPAGWSLSAEAVVLTLPIPPSTGPDTDTERVAVPDERWLAHHPRYRDRPDLLTAVRDGVVTFLRRGDAAVARAAVTAAPTGRRWVGITAVATRPNERRRGHASALCAEAVRWGAARGATHAYVQVEVENDEARSLYERLGFTEHHRYRYAENARET
ncbi:GNAT family N-acetyltransferase [Rhodococcus sp. BP-349]|uniref:N-acetylglutamate synthase, CG3035 family n=1 Tax=unclassified Rhodococcus (in: high G+C Gram-positive bacteria) TaxID=192944 RepID=UPI001C9AE30D|nr:MULTISPECIES: GNAT family N-acetyltransferase [unclassified Rhodococcus (in: high G+C Gram-positive bacteria)]MBY6539528.1 GNAT family N-acetyltransferase [Rhodococcus sp. BP-363]MBY6544144.1 GNAT family N-acetyltransferase [Rhodococcus sp. BP-369]MBY6563374.1 GNAT family N-acetyltransferase [Rhodococcus sp. BP-370]MBY6577666.1 GNAT family N-acetyltransferase [Rhodococcus sp. BP-364]MBY6586967.1 GNAT family N-acetyltransferase [Rhodococcus sp. BP-358]